jgi:hypothetical protein
MKIKTQISVGELLDKISILKIKSKKIKDQEKLSNIKIELSSLLEIVDENLGSYKESSLRLNDLVKVNSLLWDIEDDIREKERKGQFDEEFVKLARSVYYTNDKRFEIKNLINKESGSEFKEEKSYEEYK